MSLTSLSLPALTRSMTLSMIASLVVEGGISVTSMQPAALSYRHLARTRTLPRPVS